MHGIFFHEETKNDKKICDINSFLEKDIEKLVNKHSTKVQKRFTNFLLSTTENVRKRILYKFDCSDCDKSNWSNKKGNNNKV